MLISYTSSHIHQQFDYAAFRRGSDIYLSGKVISCVKKSNLLIAAIKGSQNQRYNVEIEIRNAVPSGAHFRCVCSCPVRYSCKHAVAALMADLDNKNQSAPPAAQFVPSKTYAIENWLGKLQTEFSPEEKKEAVVNTRHCLLYIIDLKTQHENVNLSVTYMSTRILKNGGYGAERPYEPYSVVNDGGANYLTPKDKTILRDVCIRKMMERVEYGSLSGEGGGELLLKMLATGRCYWKSNKHAPLTLGQSIEGKMEWRKFDDGSQQLGVTVKDEGSIVLPTVPLLYFNLSLQLCGSVDIELQESTLRLLQNSPKIPLGELPQVEQRLGNEASIIPTPTPLRVIKKNKVKPIPRIYFCTYEEDSFVFDESDLLPAMQITLSYEGNECHLSSESSDLSYREGDQLVKIKRNASAEIKIQKQLEKWDIAQLRELEPYSDHDDDLFTLMSDDDNLEQEWVQFMVATLPEMRKAGWEVSFEEDFPYNIVNVDEWHMEVGEGENNQWFDLSLDIVVDGKVYNLVEVISTLLKHNPKMFKDIQANKENAPENILVRMSDESLLAIPYERIARIVNVLIELFDKNTGITSKISLPKWRAAELNELQSQGLQWQGNDELKACADRLSQFKGIKPKAPPKNFKATLRPYQKEGLAWLQFLREYNFHGILADDMGLGKTVQALAHVCTEKKAKRLKDPVLVIAPTSLMYNWRHEAEQFSPHLKLLTLHGPDRKKDFDSIPDYDVVLTTYPLLNRDEKVLLAQTWHMIILDEAQNIKNSKAKATKVVCELKSEHRLCLTGTPMENHLGELWSIFHFLMPGLLGNERQFRQIFRTPIEKHGETERAQRLAKRLAPFMLRRTKDEVVKELPPKTEVIRSVALEGVQRDLYETVRISMQKKVRDSIKSLGLNRSHIIVLDALLKLRQICCDPRLLKTNAKAQKANSAKFDLLMSLLPELLEEGRKILLFSQFTSMLTLIEDELKAKKIKYVKLTGSTRNREKPIKQFQKGEVPLFLISLKAGGTGLNLTAADTVIHYDPWWNPAVEAQATDRAHRIGQEKPVFVYKLLTEGTVEARIQVMQENKRKLPTGLFDTAGKGKLPNANDLQMLFEPLDG